jgi:hypothetical protein
MVLIHSRCYPGYSKEQLEKDGSPEACLTRNCARSAKWETTFADDDSQAHLPGLYVAADHIFELKIKTVGRTKVNSVGYKIASTVVELTACQLGTQKSKTLLGAPNEFEGYASEQMDTKGDKNCKDKIIFTYDGEYRVLSIFGPVISVSQTNSTYCYGSPHPYGGMYWKTYKLTPNGLKPAELPLTPSLKAQIRAGCKKLFDEYDEKDICDEGQALSPLGGGALTETYYSPVRPQEGVVQVKLPQAIPASYEETKNEFVTKNRDLIDWSKAKVFTVAPDQSAVVYQMNDTLYWRSPEGDASLILGTVKDIRGWQWTDANLLTPIERQKLANAANRFSGSFQRKPSSLIQNFNKSSQQ